MKIIISHVYSDDNKGDAALLSVLLGDMRKTFDNPEITILTIDEIKAGQMFEGAPVESAFMYEALNRYQSKTLKLTYSFFVIASTILWACAYRLAKKELWLPRHLRSIADLYKDADMVIMVGGGYLRGKAGLVSTIELILVLYSIILTCIIGKQTFIYAQSIGPFGNGFQEFIAKRALKKVELIAVRENISLDLLKRMGITQNVVRSIDSGFLFTSDIKKDLRGEFNISKDKIMVGITVREWLKADEQSFYENSIAMFADNIIEKYNATVVFIPQVTATHHGDDDREVGKRVYKLMKRKESAYVITEQYDHKTIKAIYSGLDYVVGTRFHSVIFSLTSYIPAIAIEYEHKTSGIMRDLGIDEWVIKIEDVTTERLTAFFEKLVEEGDNYKDRLKSKLPAYISRASEMPILIKKAYERHINNARKK